MVNKILRKAFFSFILLSLICFFGELSTANENQKMDINTASLEELSSLKGIGEKKAQSIIKYRHNNDPFKTIEDLKNVNGIGDKLFERIKGQIEVKPSTE